MTQATQPSRLEAVLRAKENLPAAEKALFGKLYQERASYEVICRDLAITGDELKRRKSTMLRTLMQAA